MTTTLYVLSDALVIHVLYSHKGVTWFPCEPRVPVSTLHCDTGGSFPCQRPRAGFRWTYLSVGKQWWRDDGCIYSSTARSGCVVAQSKYVVRPVTIRIRVAWAGLENWTAVGAFFSSAAAWECCGTEKCAGGLVQRVFSMSCIETERIREYLAFEIW